MLRFCLPIRAWFEFALVGFARYSPVLATQAFRLRLHSLRSFRSGSTLVCAALLLTRLQKDAPLNVTPFA